MVIPDLIVISTRVGILILVDVVGCGLGIGRGRGTNKEDFPVLLISAGPEDDPQHEEQ